MVQQNTIAPGAKWRILDQVGGVSLPLSHHEACLLWHLAVSNSRQCERIEPLQEEPGGIHGRVDLRCDGFPIPAFSAHRQHPRAVFASPPRLALLGETDRSPGIRRISFLRRNADLPSCYGQAWGFSVMQTCPQVVLRIRFLFVSSGFRVRLPSAASSRTQPCLSLSDSS